MKLRVTRHLHASKDSNRELGERIGLTEEAMKMFVYACYDVEVELEVDSETGEAEIVSVDRRELK